MSDGAITLLNSMPRHPKCPWAFANPKTLEPYVSIFCSWNTARQLAGLGDVRIHDQRHSFASFLVNAGRSLYDVQKILGHTQIKTTQRYAHLSQESLIAAANEVSNVMNMFPLASDVNFIQINPVTGNRQLIPPANDVWRVVDVLGGIAKAAVKLGVEEIEVHHWLDDQYVPTRYAEQIKKRIGWGVESMQVPSIGTEWPDSDQSLN